MMLLWWVTLSMFSRRWVSAATVWEPTGVLSASSVDSPILLR